MPTREIFVAAGIALQHAGVTIYHIHKGDNIDAPVRNYWFSTHNDGSDDADHGEDGVFDVRHLRTWDQVLPGNDQVEMAIRKAIDTGEIMQFVIED